MATNGTHRPNAQHGTGNSCSVGKHWCQRDLSPQMACHLPAAAISYRRSKIFSNTFQPRGSSNRSSSVSLQITLLPPKDRGGTSETSLQGAPVLMPMCRRVQKLKEPPSQCECKCCVCIRAVPQLQALLPPLAQLIAFAPLPIARVTLGQSEHMQQYQTTLAVSPEHFQQPFN